ncbi:MAG: SGNH/GDSL hydrolase family protein [Candidatus Omnitrophota bacterium]
MKPAYRNLLLGLCSVIIFFCSAEYISRIIQERFNTGNSGNSVFADPWIDRMLKADCYFADPVLLFRINPGFEWDRINPQGFRDARIYKKEKDGGIFRIACLGDSTTFGSGVKWNNSYPKCLERMLNAGNDGGRYEVFNFGVPGYTSFQGLKLLQSEVIGYQPDVVIMNFAWNDLWSIPAIAKEDKYQRMPAQIIISALGLLERSAFFRSMEAAIYRFQLWISRAGRPNSRWHSRVTLEDHRDNYRQMISLLKKHNMRCLIIIPPAGLIVTPPAGAQMTDPSRYMAYTESTRAVAGDSGVPIIEPGLTFSQGQDKYFLEDGFHLTEKGYNSVADSVFAAIYPMLEKQ